jgi:hypothetical protein
MHMLVSATALVVGPALIGYLLGCMSANSKPGHSSCRGLPGIMRRGRTTPVRKEVVKAALRDLADLPALGRSPLCSLSGLSRDRSSAAGLHSLLVDTVVALAASARPRDAESGRLLLNYYVKRVGTHEVIMDRLCLSRPTFYRRLHRGLSLLTERLEELDASAVQSLAKDSMPSLERLAIGPDSDFETSLRLPMRPNLAKTLRVVTR